MAIVLSIASTKIFVNLAEDGEPKSFFMRLMANLVHFVSMQVIALSFGIIGKIGPEGNIKVFADYAALFFLYYSVLTSMAVAIQLFLTSQAFNAYASISPRDDDERV